MVHCNTACCPLPKLGFGRVAKKIPGTHQTLLFDVRIWPSCRGVDPVHLHTQLTFARRIDRTSSRGFIFDGVRPHIVAWVGS